MSHPEPLDPSGDLTDRLKAEALRLGFDQVGIAPAVAPPGYPRFLEWLEAGYAAIGVTGPGPNGVPFVAP